MTIQNSIGFTSTIDFLSRDCKSKNHVNCRREWTGIGIKVICRCSCHNSMTMTSNTSVTNND